jgi:hypothetical protein
MSNQIGVARNFAQKAGRVLAASSKLERAIMQYQIEVKAIRANVCGCDPESRAKEELSKFVPAACGEVWCFFSVCRPSEAGRHVALYLNDGQGSVEVEAEVREQFAGKSRIQCSRLPAGLVATTAHFGPYAGLGQAYPAIR